MKFIVEMSPDDAGQVEIAAEADAVLLDSRIPTSQDLVLRPDHRPIYRRLLGGAPLASSDILPRQGVAVDIARGQIDLDRVSADLRVIEAQTHLADRSIRLWAFLFSDLESLAMPIEMMRGSERLDALAFDEPALASLLPIDATMSPAPILYARARIVSAARSIGCPAYVRARWSQHETQHRDLIAQARQDGFDGIIGPAHVTALIHIA